MITTGEVAQVRERVAAWRCDGSSIGFVPTMGALHEGHLALVRRAKAESDAVVVSIFVNPTQFAPGEDFHRYPRDLARDSALLEAEGVDLLFAPDASTIYPPGDETVVDVPELARRWEGEFRPGHFRGVATVCTKLFGIVQPDRAWFGEKDYQQLQVIRRLAADLFLPVEIVPVPTVREADGLALSSRNAYLSPAERRAAACLHRALRSAALRFDAGMRDRASLESVLRAEIQAEPLARLDYAAVVHPESLEPADPVGPRAVALLAVRIGSTRLIDNMILEQA